MNRVKLTAKKKRISLHSNYHHFKLLCKPNQLILLRCKLWSNQLQENIIIGDWRVNLHISCTLVFAGICTFLLRKLNLLSNWLSSQSLAGRHPLLSASPPTRIIVSGQPMLVMALIGQPILIFVPPLLPFHIVVQWQVAKIT